MYREISQLCKRPYLCKQNQQLLRHRNSAPVQNLLLQVVNQE